MRRLPRLALLCPLLIALAANAAGGAEPARLSLAKEARSEGTVRITAAVTDAAGKPVEGIGVTFMAKTAFGWVKLAEANTRGDGRATVDLPPFPQYAEVAAETGESAALRAGLLLARIEPREPLRRPGVDTLRRLSPQPGFISPYPPVQIVFVGLILGGIWTTYAYIVTLLMRIRSAP